MGDRTPVGYCHVQSTIATERTHEGFGMVAQAKDDCWGSFLVWHRAWDGAKGPLPHADVPLSFNHC